MEGRLRVGMRRSRRNRAAALCRHAISTLAGGPYSGKENLSTTPPIQGQELRVVTIRPADFRSGVGGG